MSAAHTPTKIAIGSDHGGFGLKQQLRKYLEDTGYVVEDVGAFSEEAVDYPRIAHAVALRVAAGRCDVGIVIDGAGIGSAMAANKVAGVRAALCYDLSSARNSREHNNANVLSLGARLIGSDLARQIVEVFLATKCTEERHLRRAAMIEDVNGAAVSPEPPPPALQTEGPAEQESPLTTSNDISEADIERIIERIASLMGSMPAGQGGPATATNQCNCMMCSHTGNADPELVRRFIGFGADRIGHRPADGEIPRDIARYIDHTLLRPDATREQIVTLCAEAREFEFASVCVNPNWVRLCAEKLKGSPVLVCTVAGFPLGAHTSEIKAMEARRSIRDGATEIDMVINIGALKSGDDDLVRRDIAAVVEACRDGRAHCKVIIEAALLSDEEKVRACKLAKQARADYVKTSTGFGPGGATAHDVALMCETVCPAGIGVKAAGGISSYADARKMIEAGATRLGASAGVKIVQQSKEVTVSA